eukprot:gene23699-32078_t
MDNDSYNLVKALVATVARAFYTDSYIVLLDTLFRETYIVEEELGPRLKMTAKELEILKNQLESEMLISSEKVYLAADKRSFLKCYYIDYEQFVNVVRYRVYLMQKMMESNEKMERGIVNFECPSCHDRYSLLDAQRMLSGDFKFICTNCCPSDNFRTENSEEYYRLVEVNNAGKAESVHSIARKMDVQLWESVDHEGLLNLLDSLNGKPLTSNRPSDNIQSGIRSSKVEDADVADEIRLNFDNAKGANGASLIRKKEKNRLNLLNDDDSTEMDPSIQVTGETFLTENGKAPEFKINIESSSSSSSQQPFGDVSFSASAVKYTANRDTSYPEFLVNSRVLGVQETLQAVQTLQQKRKLDNANVESNEEQWKKARAESSDGSLMLTTTVAVTGASSTVQQDDTEDMDDENIEWEDDDEKED